MSSSGGNGGSNVFGIVMLFFVLIGVIFVVVKIGKAFFEFAEKNGEIVMGAFVLTLFIAFKIFTSDKPK